MDWATNETAPACEGGAETGADNAGGRVVTGDGDAAVVDGELLVGGGADETTAVCAGAAETAGACKSGAETGAANAGGRLVAADGGGAGTEGEVGVGWAIEERTAACVGVARIGAGTTACTTGLCARLPSAAIAATW